MSHLRATKPIKYTETLAYITAYPIRDEWRHVGIFMKHFEGASQRAAALGYKLEEFWLREPGLTAARASRILCARGIRGLIIAPLPHARGHLSLDWKHFATASIGYTLWQPNLHRAVEHQSHAIILAMRQLKRLGYRRIGLAVPAQYDRRVDHNWLAGYDVYQYNLPPQDRVPALVTDDWNQITFLRWFRKYRPDVIIGLNLILIKWLRHAGKFTPEHVGFVNVDSLASPGAAAIDRNGDLVGAAAVDLVVEQLHHNELGIPATPKTVMVETRWVDGNTIRNRRAVVKRGKPFRKS